jgi:hypothetical protein
MLLLNHGLKIIILIEMSNNPQFRLCAKLVKRSEGRSVVNSAAYISREKIFDERVGKVRNFSSKIDDLIFSKIYLPENAPEIFNDRSVLWNTVEHTEKRKDAQLARLIELNLPCELSTEKMIDTLEKIAEIFTSQNMIADVNLHQPNEGNDERNYHAHILLSLRNVDADGFGLKNTEWNKRETLTQWREKCAEICALSLEEIGRECNEVSQWKYGYLTLEKQREKAIERNDLEFAEICNHEPTKHKGVTICYLEKKGIQSYVLEETSLSDTETKMAKKQKELDDLLNKIIRERYQNVIPSLADTSKPIDPVIREKFKAIIEQDLAKKEKTRSIELSL